MDGMCHADDVRIAESLRGMELPVDATPAMATWNRALNRRGRAAGTSTPAMTSPTSTHWTRKGINLTFFHAFPHYFVLPMYSRARSAYRFRPLGPEETLMEIWSLARFPEGERAGTAHRARGLGVRRSAVAGDPRAGLLESPAAAAGAPRQGVRVHAPVHRGLEGHISNLHRTVDGFLAGLPTSGLLPALASVERRIPSSSRCSTSISRLNGLA